MNLLSLKSPENIFWALGLCAVIFLARWLINRKKDRGVYFPGSAWLHDFSGPGRFIPKMIHGLLLAALVILIVGLCEPFYQDFREEIAAEGVDIVMVLDISTSMSAKDFQPVNRLEAARGVMEDFVGKRPHDRLALVAFAADAYVLCPLTTDHYTLTSLLDSVELISFEADGTAIGLALACAVNRLRETTARSKVVILLTDGVNNRGEISPLQAAEFCKQYEIKVYTIGVGSGEETEVMARSRSGKKMWIKTRVDFNMDALEQIADITGGTSFSASDSTTLEKIYKEIDAMEKTDLEKKTVTIQKDLLSIFLLAALGVLLGALVVATIFPMGL